MIAASAARRIRQYIVDRDRVDNPSYGSASFWNISQAMLTIPSDA